MFSFLIKYNIIKERISGMKLFTSIMAIMSLIFIFSTLLCGLWIRNKGLLDEGSITFHAKLGIATVIISIITIIMLLVQLAR